MSRIRILPNALVDQIAAGEVIERPASVVKELVENAIDAGAHKIEISVEGGGLGKITVRDDGGGMLPDEAHLALKRHATSKLGVVEDLFRLDTMGFRGEALPSIASVSRLTLTTRTTEADAAYRIVVDHGQVGEGHPAGAPVGTELVVEELLSNQPARLKFMKAESTESAHVSETVLRLALAHPHVHMRLKSQGRMVFDLPPHPTGMERARAALSRGSRTPLELHLAVAEEQGIHVEAYLGSPAESTGTSRNVYPLVNRRFVRDRGLLQAICMGYGEMLDKGRYPLAVVHITVPPDTVDVNVHPQKLEVRFSQPQAVFGAVRHTLRAAIAKAPWLSEPPGSAMTVYSLPPLTGAQFAAEPRAGYVEHRRRAAEALRLFAPPESLPGFEGPSARPAAQGLPPLPFPMRSDGRPAFPPGPLPPRPGAPPPSVPAAAQRPDPANFFSQLSYLGQLDRTYLVCEAAGELVLIDQHAAHERVAFQRLREAHSRQKVRSQRLLLPAELAVSEKLRAAAVEHRALLLGLGFEVEVVGDKVSLSAVPETIGSIGAGAPATVLEEVLGELADGDAERAVQDRLDHLFATMACHSVVRAGDTLGEAEVRALLTSMDGVDYRAHCPHGRPVLLRISIGELERRFGRT